jgi:O-antigen/teichoic acid export membrane protein
MATVVNIAANLLLIPRFGALGAALSACVGSVTLTALNARAVYRVVPYRVGFLTVAGLRILASCLAMGIVITLARRLPLTATVAVGATTFVVSAFGTGAVRLRDLRTFGALFRRQHSSGVVPIDV